MPIALKPGKNSIKIGIDEMLNTNGSATDLADVSRWYFSCDAGKTPTVYFGSIWLVGDDSPAATAVAPVGALPGHRLELSHHGQDRRHECRPETDSATGVERGPCRGAKAGDRAVIMTGDPGPAWPASEPPKCPPITRPVEFFTPEADAICSALEVFPPDNPWNAVVSDWPVHPNSRNMIASIGREKPLRYNADMGFVLVPPGQKRVEVKLGEYSGESDKGPYPVPDNMPIEGWPGWFQAQCRYVQRLAWTTCSATGKNKGATGMRLSSIR